MNEWEKAQKGFLYDANNDEDIIRARTVCADLCYEFNLCKPSDTQEQERIIKEMLGEIKGRFVITAPFYCDYGANISIGDNCVIGAGSVVNKDIPSGVVAAGNPCKVLRKNTAADKDKYPVYKG